MTAGKALLIIDMQKGSFTAATPRFDTPGVVSRINEIAEAFRAANQPVIYIQHDGARYSEFVKGSQEWELLDELEVAETDLIIDKYANEAFYQSQLQLTLTKLNIDELYLTGCATDFCVEATLQAALSRDYSVSVVADAHTTGERPALSAKQVIDHYNWVWQHMIPTKGMVTVKSTNEVLNS